jgi:hypothetical protein
MIGAISKEWAQHDALALLTAPYFLYRETPQEWGFQRGALSLVMPCSLGVTLLKSTGIILFIYLFFHYFFYYT